MLTKREHKMGNYKYCKSRKKKFIIIIEERLEIPFDFVENMKKIP